VDNSLCCFTCLSTGTTLALPFAFYGFYLNLFKFSLEYFIL